jgi:cyclophilin family peptidyl-prolyl cis-trans isomerase
MKQNLIAAIAIAIVLGIAGVSIFAGKINEKATPGNTYVSNQVNQNATNAGSVETAKDQPTMIPTNTAPTKSQAPAMEIDKNKSYTAVLKTSEGDITLELYADKTPITVNNFVHLARASFYNKTIFHRVIKGFMIQGGDPNGNGSGGPGYQFNDEPFTGEYTRGTIAMANAGPNTNGSQFFIMHQDNQLPKNYVIFGKVIKGIEVVDKIAEAPVEQGPNGEMSKPTNPVTVNSVQITEK